MLNNPVYRSDNTWSTVNALNWSTVEIHLAILTSCTAAFKSLVQRFLPSILGSLNATKHGSSRKQHNHTTDGGGYLRQSRIHDEIVCKSGIRESVHRVVQNASEEHILEDLEMPRFDRTGDILAASDKSINGGVIEGCSPAHSIRE
ncbi:hypothetical protein BKA66DRAFT_438602 [Pyrenochaeta sp. MPI-SDFR-AT-0127]|nr:hypothetical protein BKA66DRAFT_438602 [Pyrenochaeta sp. MPI-SDFR-AT-0127]